MTTATVCIKGDNSVGIAYRCYKIDDLELEDDEHRKLTVNALQVCFAFITGESLNDITVGFDDESVDD